MNHRRNFGLSVSCLTLVLFLSTVHTTECANSPNTSGIGGILNLLQTPQIASLNVSQLLKTFPTIASQNVSTLVKLLLPKSSGIDAQSFLQYVPQIASQNLTQLLAYFPQIAGQNVSQLTQTIPEILSNTTELMQIVQEITSNAQKFSSQTGTQHTAFSSLQNVMNIPQTLSTSLKNFQLTTSTLYVISEQLRNNKVGDKCNHDFIATLVGLNWTQIWAMEMVDAMGKPPSYLRSFNFKWLGDYQECKDVRATTYDNQTFRGQYCTVDISAPAALVAAIVPEAGGRSPSFSVGVCVSDACTSEDLRGIVKTVTFMRPVFASTRVGKFDISRDQRLSGRMSTFSYAARSKYLSGLINGGDQSYDGDVKCKSEHKTLSGGSIAIVIILSLLGFLIAIGTLYDVITVQLPARRKPRASSNANGVINRNFNMNGSNGCLPDTNGHVSSMNGNVTEVPMKTLDVLSEPMTNGETEVYDVVIQPKKPEERSSLEKILLAFSAYTNGVKLLNTYQPKGAIGAINGIRFLSMAWVILGHTVLFFSGSPENQLPYMYKKVEQWTFYAYYSATVSVDSFFCLSGLLVGYLTLQQLQKAKSAMKMNWFMFYFHRFWRLTPPYMLVLMVLTGLWEHMGYGPMWPDDDWEQTKFCRKNWWVNLLYVNNYVRNDEMCMGWSWYLANDMMFYILSPLIIVPFFYNIIAGGVMASAFFLATTIAAAVIAKKHEYTALFLSIIGPRPKDADYMKTFYFPAHTRMGPYVVGLVAGYILYRYQDTIKEKMHRVVALLGWLLSFTIISLVIYGVYPDHDTHFLTVDQSVAYICLHRSAWAVALAWIIIACHTGYGGWINEILSWKAFVPLGRLTYCAYLVHPIVINVYYMARERLIYLTDNEIAYLFTANVALSFAVAFLTSLAFESPMMGLEKVIFRKDKNS